METSIAHPDYFVRRAKEDGINLSEVDVALLKFRAQSAGEEHAAWTDEDTAAQQWYSKASDDYWKSDEGKAAAAEARQKVRDQFKAAGPAIETADGQIFEQRLRHAPQPVLLVFSAYFCSPCLAATPTLNQLAEEYASDLIVAKTMWEDDPSLIERFQVLKFPTLLLFEAGRLTKHVLGVSTIEELRTLVDRPVEIYRKLRDSTAAADEPKTPKLPVAPAAEGGGPEVVCVDGVCQVRW